MERGAENSHLASNVVEDEQDSMCQLHAWVFGDLSDRVWAATGPQGVTIPASDPEEWVGKIDGFSLHAVVDAKAHERKKLERLCRYIARPPVAEKHLSLTHNCMLRYELKTPYHDGTTHVIFEPLDFISKLAALVPRRTGEPDTIFCDFITSTTRS